jgi:UDP-N-acetylmuramoyl-tripeptide--D-alanyl-D-alanine ligase
LKLEKLIHVIGGEARWKGPTLLSSDVGSFAIDSRQIGSGDVFFALSQPEYQENGFNGDFNDSTVYAASAIKQGAVAVVLRADRYEEHVAALEKYRDRVILVDDVLSAFQRLAHSVYLEWNGPVVAITGSAGKTTAKELTAHVLAASGKKVLKNIKNYNNGIGHPLTVLELAKNERYDAAVLEMGMSTPLNEIARLCRITPPDIAIVLNVLPVHLEHLGSIENIQRAKAEIVEGMKPGGTAILNADDPRVLAMRGLAKGPVITYGIDNDADVRATDIVFEGFHQTRFKLTAKGVTVDVGLPLDGKHNVYNGLAAAAAGIVLGMGVYEIAVSLGTVSPPSQRGEVLRFKHGFTVVNESYNSNPDALLSTARALVASAPSGSRLMVAAGEMLELGSASDEIHYKTGRELAEIGIEMLYGIRGAAEHLVTGARDAGLGGVHFAKDSDEAASMIAAVIGEGDCLLVKGSRGVRTEKVIDALMEKFELGDVPERSAD